MVYYIKGQVVIIQILKEEVKNRIIEAAIDDFLVEGFKLASTRNIINKAKISKGNLYNYFKSKEDLFYTITTPFYFYINNFMYQIFKHGDGEDFNEKTISVLSGKIVEMIKNNRKEFIIIMDRSAGTKYENCKSELVNILTEHFRKNSKKEFKKGSLGNGFVMQIIARNFIEALLEIANNYENDTWANDNIKSFLNYHSAGIAQFY